VPAVVPDRDHRRPRWRAGRNNRGSRGTRIPEPALNRRGVRKARKSLGRRVIAGLGLARTRSPQPVGQAADAAPTACPTRCRSRPVPQAVQQRNLRRRRERHPIWLADSRRRSHVDQPIAGPGVGQEVRHMLARSIHGQEPKPERLRDHVHQPCGEVQAQQPALLQRLKTVVPLALARNCNPGRCRRARCGQRRTGRTPSPASTQDPALAASLTVLVRCPDGDAR